MKRILFLIVLIVPVLCGTAFSQSKKDIKKNKIKSVKVTNTVIKDGKDQTLNESFQRFDASAEVIEEINYDDDGGIKSHFTYTLNKNGDKTEEISYQADGKIKKKKTIKYDANGDKIEEIHTDANGTFIDKDVFTYNANGDRTTEITLDSKNSVIHKVILLYDNKGMKVSRKSYDAKGNLESEKKYVYEY